MGPISTELKYKKIILCGPPAAGKTTLKRVFFEMANPLRLLDSTLDPTRGCETTVFRQLQTSIGIFDLGGQENARWLGADQQIFRSADIIIYINPVTEPIPDTIIFLKSLARIRSNQCPGSRLYFLYHKRDLISANQLRQNLQEINTNIRTNKLDLRPRFQIIPTSIAGEYFFSTYQIFGEILSRVISRGIVPVQRGSYQQAEMGLQILLALKPNHEVSIRELLTKIHLPVQNQEIFEKLRKMGLIKLSFDTPPVLNEKKANSEGTLSDSIKKISLTDRGVVFITEIIKGGLSPEKISDQAKGTWKLVQIFAQLKEEGSPQTSPEI